MLEQTPLMLLQEKNIVHASQLVNLEKSKLAPSINFGYNSNTFIGWQSAADKVETYFGKDTRFASVNFGLSIPIFSGAQRARINAGNILVQKNKLEQLAVKQQVNANLKDAIVYYLQNKNLVDNFQKNSMPNAEILITTATNKLNLGEIGYLEWVMIVNQAMQVRSEYFNYIQQLNEAAIEIEKISSNN